MISTHAKHFTSKPPVGSSLIFKLGSNVFKSLVFLGLVSLSTTVFALDSWPTNEWVGFLNADWDPSTDANDQQADYLDIIADAAGYDSYFYANNNTLFLRLSLEGTTIRSGSLKAFAWAAGIDVDGDNLADWSIRVGGVSETLKSLYDPTGSGDPTTENFSIANPITTGDVREVASGSGVYLDFQVPFSALQAAGFANNIDFGTPVSIFFHTATSESMTIKDGTAGSTTVSGAFANALVVGGESFGFMYDTRDLAPYSSAGTWTYGESLTVSGYGWPTSTSSYYNGGLRAAYIKTASGTTVWTGTITTNASGNAIASPTWTLSGVYDGGTATLYIENPTTPGSFSAYDTFTLISPPGEIDVSGNGVSILSGDITPSASDHTFLGSTDLITGSVNRTFTISNSGNGGLALTGTPVVALSGSADFSVTTQAAASINAGGSTIFIVHFDPSAEGIRTAVVSIESDDSDENPYTFTIQGSGSVTPEMDITGNAISILDGSTTPALSNLSDFGNTDINGGTTIHTFSIKNSGSGPLTLSGPPYVGIFGTHASDFAITQQPTSGTVAALTGVQTFEITFDPSTTGLRQATLTLTNNDPDESPYTFAIQGTGVITPEIIIKGGALNIEIASGDFSPSINDSTDFGSSDVGDPPRIVTYTIYNTGPAPLTLTGTWPRVAISGAHAGDFSVISPPSSPVSSGGSTSFKVGFDPLTSGLRSATLTIANNDLDEGAYSFAVQGTGTVTTPSLAEISLAGNTIDILNGDATPNFTDGTNLGSLPVSSGSRSQTFTISNLGLEDLALTSSPRVTITGANPLDFSVSLQPSTPIAPNGTVPFEITFNPTAIGSRTAEVRIESNDADENPYTFTVEGFGLSYPEIEIQGSSFIIPSGDATPSTLDGTNFGDVTPSFGQSMATFTIYNTGDTTLNLSGNPLVKIEGDAISDFTVTTQPSASISPGSSSDFTITFDPVQVGTRNALVSILNADSNESPYTFWITGFGDVPQTPFPCISRFYHVYGDLGIVAYMDATVNPYYYSEITRTNYHINGMGYNVEDGLLYGFEQDANVAGDNIIRIDGNLTIDVLNAITIPFLSWRADFDVSGNMFFWDANGTNIGIFDASEGTIRQKATGGIPWTPIDMAYLDADGHFYGVMNDELFKYDTTANYVSKITITGRLADDQASGVNSAYYGAAWSADDGYVFTTNSQSGRMYKIAPDGLSIYVGQGQDNLAKSDGASCPLVPAPLPLTGQIGNFVWLDTDGDGLQDAGEPGLSGVTVDLYDIADTPIASTITNSSGEYTFTGLSPSEYYIVFSNAPAGFMLTSQNAGTNGAIDSDADPTAGPNLGRTANFDVGVGLIDEGIDAGYIATGVGDFVWDDLNGNDDQDPGEPGVSGVAIALVRNSDGVTVANTTTNASGNYFFSNVAPGDYTISVTNLPGGYSFVRRNRGATDLVDSDVNNFGVSDVFTLTANDFNSSIDAGITQNSFPEINLTGNGNPILDGSLVPDVNNHTDFGSSATTVTRTFTIDNANGTADLTLNGVPVIEIGGTHAADFTVTTAPALTSLTTAQTTTFQVTFDPSDNGIRQAYISITNNDADENPYDYTIQGFGLAPEIAVKGNGQNIVSGDVTPSTTDSTDFGGYDIVEGSGSRTFTIENTGAASLDLTGSPLVAIGGTNPGDFTVSVQPATPIANGGSTTFTVTFNPTALGIRTATLSIANTDNNENPFVFDVRGTGTASPKIKVQGNLVDITNGDTSPSTADFTDFGASDIFDPQMTHTFTILNTGSADLTLNGTPRVNVSGANAGDFVVSQQPGNSTITPGGSITFQLAFDPTTTGYRQAIIVIANNDASKNPFTFSVKGLGESSTDQEMEVLGNDIIIAAGDNNPVSGNFTDMGTAEISGAPAKATFVVRNAGGATLSLTGPPPYVDFTGLNASEFSITSTPLSSIPFNGGITSFEVTFTPFALGERTATVSIQNNDSDENPYTFTIKGSGVYDPTSLSEINVTGNSINILNGDDTPSIDDGTDFQNVEVIGNFSATQEFIISNTGSDDLVLGNNPIISISGAAPGDFTVISNPASLVAPSSTVAFTIKFEPLGTGLRTATVSIGNSDLTGGENPYTFDIQGTGVTTPEMSVSGNGVTIANGDTSPGLSDSTLFGDVDITTGAQLVTYTISNTGNSSLTIGTVSVSGAQASEFTVTTPPALSVNTGSTTTFVVKFDPSSIGLRNATISIANNDPDESPYVFNIRGNGTSPSDGVIGDRVWLDNDGDGIQDVGEDPMPGITVSLYDSGDNLLGTTVSAADGSYSFQGLASGNYYLTFTNAPSGYSLSALDQGGDDALDSDANPSNGGKTATFSLNISEVDNTRDAGFTATGVGNFVWLDVNENGLQDAGETGVPGIDVEIKINGGASVATTTTDASGYYAFTNLSPNTYRLYFTGLAAGYAFTTQNVGADDAIDSDVNILSGESDAFVLGAGTFVSSIDAGVYQQSAPEINVTGKGVSIPAGDTTPSTLDDTDFGSVDAGISSKVHTFTVSNGPGAEVLTLNGTPRVVVSGAHASEFVLTTAPAQLVASGTSTTFEITFSPTVEGLRTATISISNTDPDESPYTFNVRGFGLASEIQVEGNGNVIADGDNSPTASDDTDFGSEDVLTGTQAHIFNIVNLGNADLNLLNPSAYIDITGAAAADFTVTSLPTSPIATNNSTSFTITFNPGAEGLRQATVSIANNDLDENPYTFTIQGIGLASPEISIEGNGESIADGDNSPISTDNTYFGTKDILTSTQVNSFTIKNIGSGALNLTGVPRVALTGVHAGDFLVSSQPGVSSVAPGGSVSFAVTFNPTAVGLRTAIISIANDDDDENPFTFTIQGNGDASPEINILGNSVSIASGDLTPSATDSTLFKNTIIDSTSWVTYTIENEGSALLTLTGAITISGAHSSDFTISQLPQSTVAAGGGMTTFSIRFIPSAEGLRTATVSIPSDDSDENPYTFSIAGTALPMPLPELFLVETVDLTTALPGDTLTYTVTYSNVGVGLAKHVVVDQAVPENSTYVENSAAGAGMTITFQHEAAGGYDASQAAPVTDIKYERNLDLEPGENGTVTFRVVIN